MNEQPINSNSPESKKEKNLEVVIGVLILIVIILIAGGFYFLGKNKNETAPAAPSADKNIQTENTSPAGTPAQQPVGATDQSAQPAENSNASSKTAVDFNYELKQLDSQVSSADSANLDDTEMADSKVGL